MLISSSNCLESLTLSFDEVAMAFSTKNKHRPNTKVEQNFLMWLVDAVTNDFQTYFIIEDVPQDTGIELEYKMCINSPDENADAESEVTRIAMNIAGLTLKPNLECTKSSIIVLASLFNLMRTLHYLRYDGDLESINAVLGCALILPKIFDSPDLMEEFRGHDNEMQKKLLDISFHSVNWFREVISAFVNQTDPMIRKKVLSRLSQLIAAEEQTREMLRAAPPEYTPPLSGDLARALNSTVANENDVADASVAIPLGVPAAETEGMSILGTARPLDTTTGNLSIRNNAMKSKKTTQSNATPISKEHYRQLDPDIMLLLNESLIIEYPTPVDQIGSVLGLSEFKFIMDDLIIKLESLTGVTKFVANQRHQFNNNAEDFVADIIKYMPQILKFFQQLKTHLQETVTSVKGVHDNGDLFTDQAIHVKICFGLCLRMMAALLTWSSFSDEKFKPILVGTFF